MWLPWPLACVGCTLCCCAFPVPEIIRGRWRLCSPPPFTPGGRLPSEQGWMRVTQSFMQITCLWLLGGRVEGEVVLRGAVGAAVYFRG